MPVFFFKIPATTARILLNHFKWDKEKLMEKYYDGDQDFFFREAHVINPFNKPHIVTKPKVTMFTYEIQSAEGVIVYLFFSKKNREQKNVKYVFHFFHQW